MASKKFCDFKKELEHLCLKYRVQLVVEGYDRLYLQDWVYGEELIYSNGFDDLTISKHERFDEE